MWSGRSVATLLMDLLHPSSGWDMIFPKPDEVVQFQDRNLAHEMAEGEVNIQDLLLYIILLHRNMSVPSYTCIGLLFSCLTDQCQPHTLPDTLPVLYPMRCVGQA